MRKMCGDMEGSTTLLELALHAAGNTERADDMTLAAKLPPGITLAQWFNENEPLLQQDPTPQGAGQGGGGCPAAAVREGAALP